MDIVRSGDIEGDENIEGDGHKDTNEDGDKSIKEEEEET